MKTAWIVIIILLIIIIGFRFLIVWNKINTSMNIRSPVFEANGKIPDIFTCVGENINPEFIFENIPDSAKSLAFIMDDPDASRGIVFSHWLIWNITPSINGIAENSVPAGAVQGKNDAGKIGYFGPCPPSGKPHHYRFKLFALSEVLNIPVGSSLQELETAIDKFLIAKAELIGIYEKKQ